MKARTAKSSLKLMLLSLSAVVVVVLPAVLAPSAFTQQGGPYALNQSVIAGGGGVSANGNTNVSGTIGQGVLGSSNGGSFSLNAGFWQASSPCAAASISSQPDSQTVCEHSSAMFSVTATGATLTYQWRKNTININGVTSAMLTLDNVGAPDAASYDCVIAGSCGNSVTSNAATLTVNTFSLSSSGQSFPSSGGNGSFNVIVAGGCAWTAVSNNGWISITGGAAGNGNGLLTYSLAANTGGGRTGTITAAGLTYTLSQSPPTAITLISFDATAYDGGVFLEWETGLESDNLGFNVYRAEGGNRELVNQQLVSGSALVASSTLLTGRVYSWWDKAPARSAAYWLEDIDLNSGSVWHGPVYIRQAGGAPPARSQATLLGEIAGHIATSSSRAVERVAASSRATTEQATLQAALAGQPAVKIGIQHEGWYRLTQAELVSGGLDSNVDPRFLRLFVEGREQPIIVSTAKDGLFDESASIEFYGTGLDTPATDTRVYWLIVDKTEGLRINRVRGDGVRNFDSSFPFSVERKDRTIYFSALRNADKENFFGAVIAQAPLDQTITVPHMDSTPNGETRLEVRLQGVTLVNHLVNLQLNGAYVGQVLFNNQTEGTATLDVPQSILKEEPNVVTLIAQGGPGDVSLVDYIRLTYPHTYEADDDALRFTARGNQQIRIDGFSNPAIRAVDITDPDSPKELIGQVEQQKSGFAITVASPDMGNRTLIAFSDERVRHPASLAANLPSNWRVSSQAADLLIIARRAFFSTVEPLKVARQQQGFKVAIVDVEDIYDEFSFGEKTPQAVKDFLAYAKTNWKVAPHYALMVGDASFDARNYLGARDFDLVPTKLVDTEFMETASDDWFADFNANGLAEMAIGRLPVRTAEEAAGMVSKILRYDRSTPSEGILLVADSNDGYDFEAVSEQLRELIPPALRVEEIDRGGLDPATAKSRLIEGINRGQKIVNYSGHGNMNQWRGSLLTSGDAVSLTNAEQPALFVMMTCLNGYFHDPASDSLAESLMKVEKGGAVAVWASSGMTLPAEQWAMNQQLYRLLFASTPNAQPITLGEAMLRAKASVSSIDIRRTWILFGDPTTKIR